MNFTLSEVNLLIIYFYL